MNICSVVLSGGKSSRMGMNKSLLMLKDRMVIELIIEELWTISDQVVVITNNKPDYEFLQVPLIHDRYRDKGPLAGMEAALHHVDADRFIVSACDTPFIDARVYQFLLDQMEKHDAVVPVFNNRLHPLSGIYKRTILPHVEKLLENDRLSIRKLFDHIDVKMIDEFGNLSYDTLNKHFFNMNNPSDYETAKSL
ncbi:molybdenum cofactor guanylyltransferase [Ornithinibacillus caprae]|nr:molybdenum cofactor guanylyltransferase [Ornithinibacillus caprae]